MRTYQITVNGNTYNATVKSITGDKALVVVDGLEFEVKIGDGGVMPAQPVKAIVASPPVAATAPPKPVETPKPAPPVREAPKEAPKKRISMVDQLAPKSTAPTVSGPGVVSAHLPGLILEILVKPGSTVKAGDTVIKMEAMKMVNEIRAKIGGKVKEVLVSVQQNVQESQPLMIIE